MSYSTSYQAYTYVGTHYKLGLAVEEDISKAVEFHQVAAKMGSMYALGFIG